ncbi:hypothetical protein FACS1894192_12890 [Bacilli bacterium]|nr:hypothetical protein FACS1894192_12890 [Bacilli bacterium]
MAYWFKGRYIYTNGSSESFIFETNDEPKSGDIFVSYYQRGNDFDSSTCLVHVDRLLRSAIGFNKKAVKFNGIYTDFLSLKQDFDELVQEYQEETDDLL